VDQFKQLLLKQREVMLQLSARLNERDESVPCPAGSVLLLYNSCELIWR